MALSPDIKRYVGIPFSRDRGPQQVEDRTSVFSKGSNCQLFGHIMIEILTGQQIPEDKLSKEMYEDNALFPSVSDEIQAGDIFLFGKKDEEDFRRLHVGIYTGARAENGEPLIAHNNRIDGQASIWALSKFEEFERYEVRYAAKRFNPDSVGVNPNGR